VRETNAPTTFEDIRKLARRWWWVLLLCPVLAAGTAYALSAAQTPIYRSSVTLLIEQSDTAPGSSGYNDILASERRAQTYSKLVRSREVIAEVIRRLSLPVQPEELIRRTAAAPITNTQLITITVSDTSPTNAAIIANITGQVFIDQLRTQQIAVTGSSRDALQQNADAVKGQIDDTTNRIADLSKRPDANTAENQATLRSLQGLLSQYQTTYASLLEAQQRTAIQEAAVGTHVRVAEQAVPPKTFATPRIKLNTAIAALLGLLVAIGLVALAGYLDDTMKSPDDVRRVVDHATLGSIPALRGMDGLETLRHPHSATTEAYRGLRTSLQFSAVGREIRSLAITSAQQRDGKTTTVANLAVVLAQGGQRVILVDGDLRKPRDHTLFAGVTNRAGLSNLMLTADKPDEYVQETQVATLRVLTAGPVPPNPPDLLNAPRMREILAQLEAESDLVLIDTPPLIVSDPLIVAGLVDALLVVTVAGKTRNRDLTRTMRMLAETGTPVLGVIINRIDRKNPGYYDYASDYTDPPDVNDPDTAPARAARRSRRTPKRAGQRETGIPQDAVSDAATR